LPLLAESRYSLSRFIPTVVKRLCYEWHVGVREACSQLLFSLATDGRFLLVLEHKPFRVLEKNHGKLTEHLPEISRSVGWRDGGEAVDVRILATMDFVSRICKLIEISTRSFGSSDELC
jgi:hypothetical protein